MGTLLLKAGHVGAAMTVDALSADVNSIEQRILAVSDVGWLGETRGGQGCRDELRLRFDVEVV